MSLADLAEELLCLPQGRCQHEDQAARMVESPVQGDDGGHRGLAALARAVEEDAVGLGAQEVSLPGVSLDPEPFLRKYHGIQSHAQCVHPAHDVAASTAPRASATARRALA